MKIKYILILILVSEVGFTQPSSYQTFSDFVQYSSSIDAYSNICVKNFNEEEARSELFELIMLLQEKANLSEQDIFKLKDKLISII